MTTGRTVGKFFKLQIADSANTMRDIPVTTVGNVGVTYEEVDVSALQDALKGMLVGQGASSVTITGPFDNSAAQAASGSGAAPALSGSHTVLAPLDTVTYQNTARSVGFYIGIQGYWTTGDPVFGGIASFALSDYTVDPATGHYSAKITYKSGATVPAWGTAAITAS